MDEEVHGPLRWLGSTSIAKGEGRLAPNPFEGVAGMGLLRRRRQRSPKVEPLLARRDKSGVVWSQLPLAFLDTLSSAE
jgi:hypothetical protein